MAQVWGNILMSRNTSLHYPERCTAFNGGEITVDLITSPLLRHCRGGSSPVAGCGIQCWRRINDMGTGSAYLCTMISQFIPLVCAPHFVQEKRECKLRNIPPEADLSVHVSFIDNMPKVRQLPRDGEHTSGEGTCR